MSDYRRRRFLTDLLFVGGALLAAAGLASTAETQDGLAVASATPQDCEVPTVCSATPAPADTASPVPVELPESQLPKPGGRVAGPPQIKPKPGRDPFGNGNPGGPVRAAGGAVPPPQYRKTP